MNAGQKADAAAVLERADRRRYAADATLVFEALLIERARLLSADEQFGRQAAINLGADLIEYLRRDKHDVGRAFTAMLDVADERRRGSPGPG